MTGILNYQSQQYSKSIKQKQIFLTLKKQSIIKKVFQSKEVLYTSNLMVKIVTGNSHNQSAGQLFVLWGVPRKTGNAVKRNRLKRVLRAALFEAGKKFLLSERLIHEPVNIYAAFIPRPQFAKQQHNERLKEMHSILAKILNLKGSHYGNR